MVSQSLLAAMNTVSDDYMIHSCHCYFVLAGSGDIPIYYYVERIRDGKSFVTRTVNARQRGRTIFTAICSFHRPEPAWLEHGPTMPNVPPPEELETDKQKLERALKNGDISEEELNTRLDDAELDPIEWRHVNGGPRRLPLNTDGRPPIQIYKLGWVRAKGPISSNGMKAHVMALAYLSDTWFIRTALSSHGKSTPPKGGMVVSLDHSIYFHRPFRADEWLLNESRCPGK